jgi:SAM-dependent methyltransferase
VSPLALSLSKGLGSALEVDMADADWEQWLQRWEAQQTNHLPVREERFNAMLDVLAVRFEGPFTAVDLASGPGSLARRLLQRFPEANAIAVDLDPVLLTLGRRAIGSMEERLRWVEADLRQPDWVERLAVSQVDAVLSTTALHWLPAGDLIALYRQLGQLIRPGGVFLNGDHFDFPPSQPNFRNVSLAISAQRREAQFARPGAESWDAWWEAIEAEPAFSELVLERQKRFGWRHPESEERPGFEVHRAALEEAGFREVGVIWQNLHNRVLMAVR